MKYVAVVLSVLCLLLQVRLWHGDGNLIEAIALNRQATQQKKVIVELQARNQQLLAEVQDLKYRLGAVEERARVDLGMIRDGETFYQFVSPAESELLAKRSQSNDISSETVHE